MPQLRPNERLSLRMPSANGVAAGQTALFKLPVGYRYHSLSLAFAGVTLAQMTEIRVMADGRTVQRFTAEERDTMNQFDAMAEAGSILVIPFDRRFLKDRVAEEETAINTGVVDANGARIDSFTLEIDVAAAATAPALTLDALISGPIQGHPGMVMFIDRQVRDMAGAGTFDIADLPYNQPAALKLNRVFFKEANAQDIDKLIIRRNNDIIFEREKTLNERYQNNGERIPQDGYFVVDPSERGYGGSVIDLVGFNDYRYQLDVDAAGQITVLSENLGILS